MTGLLYPSGTSEEEGETFLPLGAPIQPYEVMREC